MGADKIIDRNASFISIENSVNSFSSRPIECILDAVSAEETQQMANSILAPGGYLQLVQAPVVSFSPEKNIGFTKGLRSLPENRDALAALYGNLEEALEKELLKVCMLFHFVWHSRTNGRLRSLALLRSSPEGWLGFQLVWSVWRKTKFLGSSLLLILMRLPEEKTFP